MKKILNFLLLILFVYITIYVFTNQNIIKTCVFNGINIWFYQILPNLFPMFILSNFLLNYGFAYYLAIIFEKPFRLLFKVNGISTYIFFMSMFSGFPSGAKYIKELYSDNLINKQEATKLLTFTHFASPLFIIGFIGSLIGIKMALFTLFVHYSTNIIIGVIFRNYSDLNTKKITISQKPFGVVLNNSIKNTIDTLLMILGTIIFFNIINSIIINTNLPILFKYIVNISLEMTNAINYLKEINCLNVMLIVMVLSFGGICVHFQVLSIISDAKIKYQPYLLARLLHALISGMLVLFINYMLK